MNNDDLNDDDSDDEDYDPMAPISIFNHPPFSSMTIQQIRELEESWP